MPRRRKDEAKREAAFALMRLESAAYHIANLYHIFKPHHEDYADALEKIGQQIIIIEEEIKDIWEAAWGEFPDNVEGYTS